jgi:spore germination protein YaaH
MSNINEYKKKINYFFEIMLENKDIVDVKLSEDKWTLKEMVAHLIDSASNNHQRFIRLQIDKKLDFPIFYEEIWKDVTKIKDFDFLELVNLWKGYNYYLLHIINKIDESKLNNIWEVHGKEWTLEFTVNDYFEHMDWHIDLYKNRIEEIKLGK